MRRRVITAVAAICATVGLVWTASAYVTAQGQGEGTGGTLTSVEGVRLGSDDVEGLVPGETRQISGWVTNENDFAVSLAGIEVTLAAVIPSASGSSCGMSDFGVSSYTFGEPLVIPAANDNGHGYATWAGPTLTFVNDSDRNQEDCLDADVRWDLDVM